MFDTTKIEIFKQITTRDPKDLKGDIVVFDTTKIEIFKQITTDMMKELGRESCV